MLVKGENVATHSKVDRDVFSANWKAAFGERKPMRPGKWKKINGEWVHEDDIVRESGKRLAPLCRVRDESRDIEIHRASRDMGSSPDSLVRVEKAYKVV